MISRVPVGDYVVTDRGGIVENRYSVHAAVTDAKGQLLFAVGDPSRFTLARSAAKPAQALAILETGAFDAFNFDGADLALMCASHSSEPRHIDRARGMLKKAGVREQDLKCGGHAPLSDAVNRDWIKRDYSPTAICNNCSGKHAGMLAGAQALDAGVQDYHLPSHPMQIQVRKVFESLSGQHAHDVRWGLDGCNLPAPAIPLHVLASIYSFFASSVDVVGIRGDSTDNPGASRREIHAARIFRAMTEYSEFVGGEGRFCTELMQASVGEMMTKVGADGCYGIGLKASEQTKRLGTDGAIGIAVKIEDGHIDILYAAVIEILKQLGIGTSEMYEKLARFHQRDIKNTMDVVTGHVSYCFEVRDVREADETST